MLGLCIAISLAAISVPGAGWNHNPHAYDGHQFALGQTDAHLFMGHPSALKWADAIKSIQKLYSSLGSQSALERADAIKALQKLYGKTGNYGPFGDN